LNIPTKNERKANPSQKLKELQANAQANTHTAAHLILPNRTQAYSPPPNKKNVKKTKINLENR